MDGRTIEWMVNSLLPRTKRYLRLFFLISLVLDVCYGVCMNRHIYYSDNYYVMTTTKHGSMHLMENECRPRADVQIEGWNEGTRTDRRTKRRTFQLTPTV